MSATTTECRECGAPITLAHDGDVPDVLCAACVAAPQPAHPNLTVPSSGPLCVDCGDRIYADESATRCRFCLRVRALHAEMAELVAWLESYPVRVGIRQEEAA
jgi:hypothetical protein